MYLTFFKTGIVGRATQPIRLRNAVMGNNEHLIQGEHSSLTSDKIRVHDQLARSFEPPTKGATESGAWQGPECRGRLA